jgi:hypothetical protein
MKKITPVLFVLLFIGCSAQTPPDMIEIVDGDTEQEKYNRAVVVMRALLNDGYPDPSCSGPDADLVQCGKLLNSELLEIAAITNKYTGQVYLQCVIYDALRHDELLDDCLGRIREALTDPFIKTMQNPEAQAIKRDYIEMREREAAVLEEADWIGRTGLPEEVERAFPQYLRIEFGEFLIDDGLRAADLEYMGRYSESDGIYHFWIVPSSDGNELYGYVRERDFLMDWGGRKPTEKITE